MATGSSSGGQKIKSMGTTQFMNATLAAEKPIFGRAKINHTPPHPVNQLLASNRRIVLVMANRSIQRIDQTRQDDNMEIIELAKTTTKYKIHAAFMDPMGYHLMLSLKPTDPENQPDMLYIPPRGVGQQQSKPKISNKLRGHLVTSVAWCPWNTNSSSTGPILLGTTRGLIFESEISTESTVFSSGNIEKQFKQVYDIGRGQAVPITGLEYHNVPKSKKFFILATTPTRLYQFQGIISGGVESERPLLVGIFNDYLHVPERYLDLPSSLKSSMLSFYYEPKDASKLAAKIPLYPRSFGWMTEQGVYSGVIDPFDKETVTVDCRLTSLQNRPVSPSSGLQAQQDSPLGFILTEFHIVIAFSSHVRGICLLNDQIVFDDDLDMIIKGINRDPVSGTIYVYSDYVIHKYNLDHEDKHIWKIYLDKSDYILALRYCYNEETKLDQVYTKQASDLFEQQRYIESAEHYSKTKGDFEAVALKFLLINETDALLLYLRKRLEVVRSSEKTQLTMIIVWIVEIYLNKMGAKANAPKQTAALTNEDIEAVSDALDDQTSSDLLALMAIPKVNDCINQNRNTFYSLLASHGDKTNLIKFANVLNDFDRVIRYHLQDNEFEPVLAVLEAQLKIGRADLFYQYGPALMQSIPKRFVESVIQQGRQLRPLKLIPSLVVASRADQELEAIRYLEYCVNSLDNKDPPVHNYLLSLYIKHQEEKVLDYLLKCGTDPVEIKYDMKYALRLCCEKPDMKRECVFLFCVLGQVEEAVSVALDFLSIDEAKKCLDFAKDNEELQRKIWLMIARHVVKNKNDIKTAMEFLQQCNGLVKIEDILPFFPDFVTIDHFKGAICDSLQEYSAHIQDLKNEMDEAYSSAERIRGDIHEHKSRYTFVRATEKCCMCRTYLMARPFHLFTSCGHKFHTDCLIEAVRPHLSVGRQKKLAEVTAELESKQPPDDVQSVDSRSLKLSRKDQLRAELDNLVASECIHCGEVMIKMIDKPFISNDNFDRVMQDWQ